MVFFSLPVLSILYLSTSTIYFSWNAPTTGSLFLVSSLKGSPQLASDIDAKFHYIAPLHSTVDKNISHNSLCLLWIHLHTQIVWRKLWAASNVSSLSSLRGSPLRSPSLAVRTSNMHTQFLDSSVEQTVRSAPFIYILRVKLLGGDIN